MHSGQEAPNRPPHDLIWTREQMWNNRRDVAVLFDANGDEVDRCAYPPERPLRRLTQRRKRLARNGETWRIMDEPRPEIRTGTRRDKRVPHAHLSARPARAPGKES